jgi:hypothetical protein
MGQPGRSDVRSRPPESIGRCEVSGGTETSQYPEEKKSTEIPQVVVSERGRSPNLLHAKPVGVVEWGLEDLVERATDRSQQAAA